MAKVWKIKHVESERKNVEITDPGVGQKRVRQKSGREGVRKSEGRKSTTKHRGFAVC